MAFESGVVPENWISAVIVPLYKGKLQRIECKNYRGISLLGVVGKMYARILKDLLIMSKMALLQGGVVDQIITLKKIGQKAERKNIECMWVLLIWRKYTTGIIGKLYGRC